VSVRGSVRGTAQGARRFRRPWWVTLLRRVTGLVMLAICLGLAAFGGLLALTPSVGNARALARAQDARHHAPYPGPVVPSRFATALEATEDHRFNSEPGIDPFALARVGYSYLTGHGDTGGATLYQQLAKLLYTDGRTGWAVAPKQVALAVKLRFTYSRPEILRLYSDVAYFGNDFWGLERASCGYFGVRPAAMSWPQAALLAGLVNGPSIDDPITDPLNARAREVHVIGRLVATGTLTPAQARADLRVPLRALIAGFGSGCPA
jgi:membrane peptidoglycan carboxypeptidase